MISPWSYSSPREITPSQKVPGVRLSATFQNIHCLVGWLGSGVRVRASFLIFSKGRGWLPGQEEYLLNVKHSTDWGQLTQQVTMQSDQPLHYNTSTRPTGQPTTSTTSHHTVCSTYNICEHAQQIKRLYSPVSSCETNTPRGRRRLPLCPDVGTTHLGSSVSSIQGDYKNYMQLIMQASTPQNDWTEVNKMS